MPQSVLLLFIYSLFFFPIGCTRQPRTGEKEPQALAVQKIKIDSSQQKFSANIQFIGDTLLKEKRYVINNYLAKYQTDTCGMRTYKNKELQEVFGRIKSVGDITGDKQMDAVFVLPPFDYCDDGDSYVFIDTSLPRLYTNSYCCHSDNLFSIGDIDGDGVAEICIFYSSCVSRFKSLIAYSLKARQWKQIGRCTFDVAYMLPEKEKRVRKTGKGKFEMLEVNQNGLGDNPNGKREWKPFSF